jgi:hypothetical protein
MFALKSRFSQLLSWNLVVKTPPKTNFPRRNFSNSILKMSDISVELTAPNGKKYTQPQGLFINNEFVKSVSGEKITSINATWATRLYIYLATTQLLTGI